MPTLLGRKNGRCRSMGDILILMLPSLDTRVVWLILIF